MAPSKHCDHPKRKLDKNLVKVLDALQKLKDVNVSYHLVVHMEGHSQSFGTDNACNVFEENKEQFEKALIDDALNLCDREGPESDVDTRAVAKKKAYALKHGEGLERLPVPLSLMNRKEKLAYLRYLISYDRRERLGLDSTRIVAADETWKARFWPNDVLKWSNLTINIGLLKEEHLGGESPTSFYTKVIMAAFQLFKINPEKFVAKNLNDKMLKVRKKGLGIHDSPQLRL